MKGIKMGAKDPSSSSGQQDIWLGQMLDEDKDAIKDKFNRIIIEEYHASDSGS